jgi:hypothetical protein
MGRVDVGLYAGALRFCRRLLRAGRGASAAPPREGSAAQSFELGACAAFEAGGLRATASGLRHNGSGLGRWLAPESGLTAVGHLAPHFALSLEVDGLAPIVREHFLVDTTLVYRPGFATVRGLLGLRFKGW